MTYQEWFSLYLSTYKQAVKPRTLEEYQRQHCAYIAPIIGTKELDTITAEDIQAIINRAAKRGDRIAQAVYALLHAVFRRAVRSRHLLWSPVDAIDRPKHKAQEGQALTDEDLEAAAPFVLEDLSLSLALYAGLRRAEICGLQWQDIDLPHGVLHVRRIRHRVGGALVEAPPKSEAGFRDIPISPELLSVIRKHYRLDPCAYCVPSAPEAIDRAWRRIQQSKVKLSQPYRLHDLRHTYVTQTLLTGVAPRVVQYLAGHSALELTLKVYTHITADKAKKEVERARNAL